MLSKNKEYAGMEFSDEDDDETDNLDTVREQVSFRLQENTDNVFRAFKTFLSTPSFINSKGDETTNIVDIQSKKCYNIPDRKIPKYFKFLEVCRRKKLKCMMYEKQGKYSGIMLDFDFKLNAGGDAPINHTHYHRLCVGIFKILIKFLHFQSDEIGKPANYHVGFTKKPKILYDNEGDFYKYGIHMLIPGIQITREFKKLIIDTINTEELLDKVFKDITPHNSITRTDFLDKNSAHVGTFFIGSASKINTPAYEFDATYNVQITVGEVDDIIPMKMPEFANLENNNNICYEFSLNWAKNSEKGGIIVKRRFDIKSEYSSFITQYNSKKVENEEFNEEDSNYNEMSILNIHDVDTTYIKTLLDILHPSRSEDYAMWMEVLCALAHTSPSYKALGEYFSKKSPEKFDAAKFDQIWDSILSKKTNKLSMGSLHYWAKMDNPDRYEEVKHRSIFNLLYKKIYDPSVEGNLEHYDLAEILNMVLKDKYVYDKYDGDGGSWYEFILENEPKKTGEAFKWRKYDSKIPNTFLKYISTILPNLFNKILTRIKSTLDDASTELAKYHYNIYKNFQKSCRNLKNSGFKHSSSKEAEQIFEKMGFAESLDSDPNLKGVANGILQLGPKCNLITGFHGHMVSKYTAANYKKFNPNDPITAKVLIALRNLFPDNEPDTFNYIMHYLASTLDGHKKESIFLILVGKGSNGKSFLVELHKGAIGSIYGVKMPLSFLTSRSKDAESATPALMQLKDAHFAYYSESNKFEVLNMAKIKEFTGQETLAGRKLHQDYVNFKPKCHHLVASNNDFEISGTDHGTWRRIDYATMKIKFCNTSTDEYDEKNPYERVADPSLGSKWAEDDEVLASYLGILVYFYESLQKNYGGKVRSVAHPHIRKETEEFRNRQDRVNNFLNRYLVKTSDEEYVMSVEIVKERFIKWHESHFPGVNKEYQRHAIDQLENSKMQAYITKSRSGSFLKGYKILDLNEEAADDEVYYTDLHESNEQNINGIKSESAMELLSRLCAEFKEVKDLQPSRQSNGQSNERPDYKITKLNETNRHSKPLVREKPVESDSGSDSDIEDIVKITKTREPTKSLKFTNTVNNISNLDSNGIKIPSKVLGLKNIEGNKKTNMNGFNGQNNNNHMEFMIANDSENESDVYEIED
jgi:phage/plasmid-associated DNA primase